MTFNLTERQMAFVEARADEVFYGGAAGGGKSFAQVADAFLYALQYPGSIHRDRECASWEQRLFHPHCIRS